MTGWVHAPLHLCLDLAPLTVVVHMPDTLQVGALHFAVHELASGRRGLGVALRDNAPIIRTLLGRNMTNEFSNVEECLSEVRWPCPGGILKQSYVEEPNLAKWPGDVSYEAAFNAHAKQTIEEEAARIEKWPRAVLVRPDGIVSQTAYDCEGNLV